MAAAPITGRTHRSVSAQSECSAAWEMRPPRISPIGQASAASVPPRWRTETQQHSPRSTFQPEQGWGDTARTQITHKTDTHTIVIDSQPVSTRTESISVTRWLSKTTQAIRPPTRGMRSGTEQARAYVSSPTTSYITSYGREPSTLSPGFCHLSSTLARGS